MVTTKNISMMQPGQQAGRPAPRVWEFDSIEVSLKIQVVLPNQWFGASIFEASDVVVASASAVTKYMLLSGGVRIGISIMNYQR